MGSACRCRDPKAHKRAGPVNETGQTHSVNKKTKPTPIKGFIVALSTCCGRTLVKEGYGGRAPVRNPGALLQRQPPPFPRRGAATFATASLSDP